MKRREFLNSSIAASAAALVTPAVALAGTRPDASATPMARGVAPRSLSRAWFEKNLKSRFLIEADEGRPVQAVLVEIKDRAASECLDQFSVVFQTPAGAEVSGLRWLNHAEGRFQLVLDDPQHVGNAQMHEAQFSLLR
jgi:hypothetical protein